MATTSDTIAYVIGGYAGGQAGRALFQSIGINAGVGQVVGADAGGTAFFAAKRAANDNIFWRAGLISLLTQSC